MRRRGKPRTQLFLLAVFGEGYAIHRADVDARVALDAQLAGEHRLHVAVETAVRFLERELDVEAEFDLRLDVLQGHGLVAQRYLVTLVERDVVVVAPLVDAHLLAHHLDRRQWAVGHVLAGEHLVDRHGGLVAVRHRPDDVLRAEGGVAAEEHLRMRRGEGRLVDLGHAPLVVELDADVALDPGERVLLADGDEHVVAGEVLVRLAGMHQLAPALGVVLGLHLLEGDAGELAVVVREFLRHEEIVDRDALVLRVFLFPRRRLHLLEAGAHDDVDLFAAETPRRAAAVHGGVAAAEHDDALADLRDMAERHARQPVDADMDVLGRFRAARNVEVAAARRAGADEDRVPAFGDQRLETVDALAAVEFDAEVEDVAGLLVDDRVGQTEFRDLRADHAARLGVLVEHDAGIAERSEVAGDGERGGPAADQRDALAVLALGRLRHPRLDVVLVVGGDALQAADRHRLVLDADATAGRLAWPVAGAPEHARKHVRLPIDHVGVVVTPLRDQTDVFGDRRVRRARPLAVDHFVEVVRRSNVSVLH